MRSLLKVPVMLRNFRMPFVAELIQDQPLALSFSLYLLSNPFSTLQLGPFFHKVNLIVVSCNRVPCSEDKDKTPFPGRRSPLEFGPYLLPIFLPFPALHHFLGLSPRASFQNPKIIMLSPATGPLPRLLLLLGGSLLLLSHW